MKKESGQTEKFIDYEYYHPKAGASKMKGCYRVQEKGPSSRSWNQSGVAFGSCIHQGRSWNHGWDRSSYRNAAQSRENLTLAVAALVFTFQVPARHLNGYKPVGNRTRGGLQKSALCDAVQNRGRTEDRSEKKEAHD